MNINKAIVYGRITQDIEVKSLPSGISVINTGVATNRYWTDKSGDKKEDTQFHNVVIFGKTADNVAKYLSKGDGIYIEGRLQTQSWESDGVKKYRTEIVAETVQFGEKKRGDSNSSYQKQDTKEDINDKVADQIDPEDIPF